MDIGKNGIQVLAALGLVIVIFLFLSLNKKSLQNSFQFISSNSSTPIETNYPLITSSVECLNAGGEWEYSTGTRKYRCVYNYSDGNSLCTSSDQCQGLCIVSDYVDKGSNVVGRCTSTSNQSGCYSEIGRYRSTGVIDCVEY